MLPIILDYESMKENILYFDSCVLQLTHKRILLPGGFSDLPLQLLINILNDSIMVGSSSTEAYKYSGGIT